MGKQGRFTPVEEAEGRLPSSCRCEEGLRKDGRTLDSGRRKVPELVSFLTRLFTSVSGYETYHCNVKVTTESTFPLFLYTRITPFEEK